MTRATTKAQRTDFRADYTRPVQSDALGQSYAPEGAGGPNVLRTTPATTAHGRGSQHGGAGPNAAGHGAPGAPREADLQEEPGAAASRGSTGPHRPAAGDSTRVPLGVELLATCLAGEAGIKPAADHPAILHVLHRLAIRRRRSVEHVTARHCNASVSAKGVARVEADRLRYPQHWEALVQAVEAFDARETPNPCAGADTWGGPVTDRDVIAAKAIERVKCKGETRNHFFRSVR